MYISHITAEFIWRMGEILDIYECNYDAEMPVICFDKRLRPVNRRCCNAYCYEARESSTPGLLLQTKWDMLRDDGR